jgi:hypothetical protein
LGSLFWTRIRPKQLSFAFLEKQEFTFYPVLARIPSLPCLADSLLLLALPLLLRGAGVAHKYIAEGSLKFNIDRQFKKYCILYFWSRSYLDRKLSQISGAGNVRGALLS